MHDRRDDRGRSRRDHDRECDGQRQRDGDGHREGGGGREPNTRFLQLEMSEVLYADAESVTKQALRELLLEECKVRLRERFGDQITGIAQLAADELMQGVFASLEIEERIREQNRDEEGRRDRLADILRAGRQPPPEEGEDGGSEPEDEE